MEFEQKVLDHGYFRLIEHWGSDERVIEAARMSTNKGFLGWGPTCKTQGCALAGEILKPELAGERCPQCGGGIVVGDEKLLKYLYENKHATPFEFAGCIIEVQAPIFVFREWHRHRTQSYNEMSARYTPLPDLNYVPTVERILLGKKPAGNKQAAGVENAEELDEAKALGFQEGLKCSYAEAERFYQKMLGWGVPKELARVHLPVGRYSRMRASTCLRNWLAFLTLRMDKNSQWEIRQYANAMGKLLRQLYPRTWQLFAASHDGKWEDGLTL